MTWWISDINFDISAIYGQGVTIAIIGYVIVFLALVLSFALFSNVPRILYYRSRRELKRNRKQQKQQVKQDIHMPAEVTAAIATALYLHYNELHDPESNIITIERVRKRYTPWSSKIYGLRKWPHQTF
ncbi:MAG: OadG family protein [Bacteroidales bacterium]|nr:OadG family protein [Bacteroidales bacterium]